MPFSLRATVLGALAIRLVLIAAGLPEFPNPDEPHNIVVGAHLADAGTADPHTFDYPSLLYDVTALTTLAFRTLHLPAPAHAGITFENLGTAHAGASGLILALRIVSVLVATATCWLVGKAVYGTCLTAASPGTAAWSATIAAAALAVSPLAVANSTFVTPDIYAGFAIAVALYGASRVLQSADHADLWCGAGIGLGLGAKYVAAATIPPLTAYLYTADYRKLRNSLIPLLRTTACAVAVFVLTTPTILIAPNAVLSGLSAEVRHYNGGHPGAEGDTLAFYLSTLWHDQPFLVVLFPLGVVAAASGFRAGRALRGMLLAALAFALAQFALLATLKVHFDRNLVPLTPALAVAAGLSVCWLRCVVPRPSSRLSVAVLAGLAASAVLIPGPSLLRLPTRLSEPSRAEAASWIAAHVPAGATVVDEAYGPFLRPGRYQLVSPGSAIEGPLPAGTRALVVTEHEAGRYLGDPSRYPAQAAAYRSLEQRYRLAARFTAGSWIEIYVPR